MRLGLGRDEAAIKQTLHTLCGGRGGAGLLCVLRAAPRVPPLARSISVQGGSQTGYVD